MHQPDSVEVCCGVIPCSSGTSCLTPHVGTLARIAPVGGAGGAAIGEGAAAAGAASGTAAAMPTDGVDVGVATPNGV